MENTIPTKKEIARSKSVIKRLEEKGYKVRSYSGRMMFGRYCVGVTVPRYEIEAVTKAVRKAVASTDNMGLDYIVYWPHLVWAPEFDRDEEED